MAKRAPAVFLALFLRTSLSPQDVEPTLPDVQGAIGEQEIDAEIASDADLDAEYKDVYTETGTSWQQSAIFARYGAKEGYTRDLSPKGVRRSIEKLRALLGVSAGFETGHGPRIRDSLTSELDELLDKIEALPGTDQRIEWSLAKGFVSSRFQMHTFDWKESDRSSNSIFFPRRPSQVVLRVDVGAFVDGDFLADESKTEYHATLAQAIEFRTVVSHVLRIFGEFQIEALERVAVRLGEIDDGWTNYLEKGFSQYPWEALVNSYTSQWVWGYAWDDPPRSQFVVAHPELGVALDVRDLGEAEAQEALLVHGLGYIHYFGAERSWFAGASATAALTTDSAFGVGFGPTLHLGWSATSARLPHLSASLLWFQFDDSGDGPIVGLSIDLWRFVDSGIGEGRFSKLLSTSE